MKLSNKKFQERCQEDAQIVANELNEAVAYQFFEDKFYTESQYKELCRKTAMVYKNEYTDEDWEKDKSWDILEWYYPKK